VKNDKDILSLILSSMMGGTQLPQLPQMDSGSSFITDALTNWKLKRMQTYSERCAAVYENYSKMLQSQTDITRNRLTLSDQIESAKASIIIALKTLDTELQIRQQQLEQEKIKTNSMITEYKTNELTYQKMQKELEYDSSAKDR
jgi:hypothetical protein